VRWGRLETEAGIRLEIEQTLESFAGVVQLARHGFGHALVPWGIARALGVAAARLVPLPAPGLRRPVSLVARPSTLVQEEVSSLLEAIQDAASRLPADTFAPG
jgi:DNA-binding transcriptional LysR family regulator